MTPPPTRKIVFAPDLIGAGLIDPAARRVLESWRDDKFIVVMNRELIAFHLRALKRIGLAAELIKRWAYWLSSPQKTIFVDAQSGANSSVVACEELAAISKANAIVCWQLPRAKYSSIWRPARDY